MKKNTYQNKSNPFAIKKFEESFHDSTIINNLRARIKTLDQKISEITKALIETQVIGIKASLSANQGWLKRIQSRWYASAVKESASWHRDRLVLLTRERNQLQDQLDRLTGNFWKKRLLKWISFIFLGLLSIFILWVILMGILTAIYLLPIWGTIMIVYMIIKHNNRRLY